jgi:arginine exporter protein ArgO
MDGLGSGIKDIALAMIGVAFVALLVSNATGAANLIKATGDTFTGLLGVVTLQGSHAYAGNNNSGITSI